ncbi:Luminescence regulatory protein LuxO [compost metagenome]
MTSDSPTIIFLDINLPDGSGLDALPAIKSSHPQSTIISISALDAKEKALANGASYFIGKPFTINEINSIVNSIVH